ncbi:DMC1 protein [Salpingoeca rosetta]|uniref:DMC1 protein n=1 Tax=Salpingoeca rosetta (strain ATCC 50818 / BSB-021) TaxID=946362 RepID=F2U8L6_SALR5|nr:DMC1 protein [Salpingoeca rosetta]EGD72724.1 DMC1 protein [Salpingoeca rosetta]|eukprot:XP_004994547.1 DMC1 protein [Salpingoeca rosetta]
MATEVEGQIPMEEGEGEELDMIEKLQTVGIGMSDITKLKNAGFFTVKSVILIHPKKLKELKGFSEAKVEKVLDAAKKLAVGDSPFVTAANFLEARQQVFFISTGAKELDAILGGGIESQQITEIHGEYRTGKSQICMTLCISAQVPTDETNYSGGKVIYIDTEGAFRPERLEGICDRFNVDYQAALNNVYFCRAYNSEQLATLMADVGAILAQEAGIVRLLIIDSIMATFRTDYCGRGELAERQQMLNQVLAAIKRLAEEWNLAVVLTNQMCSDPGATMSFVSDPKKPVGGHILAHAVQTRLSLRKGSGEQRFAKLVCSSRFSEKDASFNLTEGGVANSE